MDIKTTIKNLHEQFPEFDLETVMKILECYVEDSNRIPYNPYRPLINQPDDTSWLPKIYGKEDYPKITYANNNLSGTYTIEKTVPTW